MAKTNWQDPKTGEIISPHISGLQEAVGKIEESIGIETVAETDIPLSEVFISIDDRCRIYQAPGGKRNWLLSPTPIIKKNGDIITDDFEIDYGGGAIVFTTPILETDTLTADATYTVKIEGKQLSANDYTDEEKEKNQSNKENIENLAGIGRTNETVKKNADDLVAHKAEMVSMFKTLDLSTGLLNGWTIYDVTYPFLFHRSGNIVNLTSVIRGGVLTYGTVIATIGDTTLRPKVSTQIPVVIKSGRVFFATILTDGTIKIVNEDWDSSAEYTINVSYPVN